VYIEASAPTRIDLAGGTLNIWPLYLFDNWDVIKRHIDGDKTVRSSFERIRDIATAMRAALGAGDWPEVERQVAEEWNNRKRLAPGVTTPEIDSLLASAAAAGAHGGKVCGAGGGGCLFCISDPSDVPAIRRALADGGARVLDFEVEREGLRMVSPDGAPVG
jgi:D-glycero-alpha-D-manno-heptose-7-phosphate kinase